MKLYFWSLSSVFFFNVIGDCYPSSPSPPPIHHLVNCPSYWPSLRWPVQRIYSGRHIELWILAVCKLHPPTQVKKFWQGHLFSQACAWCLWEDRQLYHHGSRPQRVNIETCVCFFCTSPQAQWWAHFRFLNNNSDGDAAAPVLLQYLSFTQRRAVAIFWLHLLSRFHAVSNWSLLFPCLPLGSLFPAPPAGFSFEGPTTVCFHRFLTIEFFKGDAWWLSY